MFAGKTMRAAIAIVAAVGAVVCSASVAVAQQGRQYTAADYAQAEKFMNYNLNPLVYHSVEKPVWLADGRFWYRDAGPGGVTYTLVDPVKGTKGPAFDHVKLAAAMTAAAEGTPGSVKTYKAGELPISQMEFADGDKTVIVTVGGTKLRCDLS